jgi:hypothetical protein
MFLEDKSSTTPSRENEDYSWDVDETKGVWDCVYTLDRDSWTVFRVAIAD